MRLRLFLDQKRNRALAVALSTLTAESKRFSKDAGRYSGYRVNHDLK